MSKLTKDEIVTLQVLNEKGKSKRAIARQLNVSEGTVRYHLRRQAASATDGRKKQPLIEKQNLAVTGTCYEGAATDQLTAPKPLGRMARKLDEIGAMAVE